MFVLQNIHICFLTRTKNQTNIWNIGQTSLQSKWLKVLTWLFIINMPLSLTLLAYTPWSSWLPPSSTLHLSSLLICLDFLAWTIQKSSPCLFSSHLSSRAPSSFLSPRLLWRHPPVWRSEGLVPDSQRHRDHQRAREAPKPPRALQSDASCKHGLKGKHLIRIVGCLHLIFFFF